MAVGRVRLGMDAAFPVGMTSRHRLVRGVVDEDPTLAQVLERRAVCIGEMLCGQHLVWWSSGHHATR